MIKAVKLIALAAAFSMAACKQDTKQAEAKALRAEAQFQGVQPGMLGVRALQVLGDKAVEKAEMTQQISMPTMDGKSETWTTIRYKLEDGSDMYVTYDGLNVVSKQRLMPV